MSKSHSCEMAQNLSPTSMASGQNMQVRFNNLMDIYLKESFLYPCRYFLNFAGFGKSIIHFPFCIF